MNFEDIQVIWDSQNERTMYQFDEQALVSDIQTRGRSIASYVSFFEVAMAVSMAVYAFMLLMEPIVDRKEYYQIPPAILAAGIAVFIWRSRRSRQKNETKFDQSLLGMLDRSIYQLSYKIRLSRSFPWWFLLPLLIGMCLYVPFVYHSKPIWLWPVVVAGWVGLYIPLNYQIRNGLLPVKAELETLREKLANANDAHPTSSD